MALKIAIIGAGSLFWSSTLIHDLCLTPEMRGSKIYLMDVDKERLDTIYCFAVRYSSEVRFDIKFYKTTDRREAIRDSDFVLNVAMAGGHQYYEKMRTISEKFGYFRGINSVEWNMVSDYHTIWGYYQFKLAMDIAEDVESLSPSSWLIQLSNPVFELTTLIGRQMRLNLVGVCHGHQDYRDIVGSLRLNEDDMEVESIGLNHTIWMTRFNKGKEDAYPIFNEWIGKEYQSFYKDWLKASKSNPLGTQMSPAMVDMYKEYGLVPVGDTVRSGTWKYHRNLKTKMKWYGRAGGFDSPEGWKHYLEMEDRNIGMIKNALENAAAPLYRLFPAGISTEPVVPLITSLSSDAGSRHQVNVMNRGKIDGIPGDVAVEVPALLNRKGVHAENGKKLPGRILNFSIRPRVQRMEWALEAFLEGGKETMIEWLMTDPRTKNDEQAEQVVNALLLLDGNESMAKHFR